MSEQGKPWELPAPGPDDDLEKVVARLTDFVDRRPPAVIEAEHLRIDLAVTREWAEMKARERTQQTPAPAARKEPIDITKQKFCQAEEAWLWLGIDRSKFYSLKDAGVFHPVKIGADNSKATYYATQEIVAYANSLEQGNG